MFIVIFQPIAFNVPDRGMQEAKGFKHILDNTKARCFNLCWDFSLGINITYFTGTLNDFDKLELLWLAISGGGGYIEETASWIPLQKLHYLFVDSMEVWNSFQQQMHTDSQVFHHALLEMKSPFTTDYPFQNSHIFCEY